jgi:hypothetical protein
VPNSRDKSQTSAVSCLSSPYVLSLSSLHAFTDSSIKKTYNPNNQDMAVLGASRAFTEWQVSNGVAVSGEAPEDDDAAPVEAAEEVEKPKDYSDRELQALEDEDPLSLIDSLNTRVGTPAGSIISSASPLSRTFRAQTDDEWNEVFNIEQYLPDAWKPEFDSYKRKLLEVLSKTGLVALPASRSSADRPGSSPLLPLSHPSLTPSSLELTRAREAHSAVVGEIEGKKQEREKKEAELSKDWGRDWEWKKLDGTCVEKDLGEYVPLRSLLQ